MSYMIIMSQYPYLKKIFDSDEFGFKKLKIKVFEINYEKFHENERIILSFVIAPIFLFLTAQGIKPH